MSYGRFYLYRLNESMPYFGVSGLFISNNNYRNCSFLVDKEDPDHTPHSAADALFVYDISIGR